MLASLAYWTGCPAASGLMATSVISAVVASGPMDSDLDEPSSAYTISAGNAAHSPVTGGSPAIVA